MSKIFSFNSDQAKHLIELQYVFSSPIYSVFLPLDSPPFCPRHSFYKLENASKMLPHNFQEQLLKRGEENQCPDKKNNWKKLTVNMPKPVSRVY